MVSPFSTGGLPAVHEGLLVIGDRLAAVGLRLVEDGVAVPSRPDARW